LRKYRKVLLLEILGLTEMKNLKSLCKNRLKAEPFSTVSAEICTGRQTKGCDDITGFDGSPETMIRLPKNPHIFLSLSMIIRIRSFRPPIIGSNSQSSSLRA
jgi:hypothetical protein